jgi:hypothetical protein
VPIGVFTRSSEWHARQGAGAAVDSQGVHESQAYANCASLCDL